MPGKQDYDRLTSAAFRAESRLADALNSTDLMASVSAVQPQSITYRLLQDNMRLITGQYTGDCYEIPESNVREMAINMERLRWMNTGESRYIHVNIPSYTLELIEPDTAYTFKVILGKPGHATPTLQSSITHFTTGPEWTVPKRIFEKELLPEILRDTQYLVNNHLAIYDGKGNYITPDKRGLAAVKSNPGKYFIRQASGCDNALGKVVFRFVNTYNIYLHDTPEPQLFKKSQRAYSHGCIRVEDADRLAALLLKLDGAGNKVQAMYNAVKQYKRQNFYLTTPVPIIISYLTCEMKDGQLLTYKDIYDLDGRLETALYGSDRLLTQQ